MNTVRESIGLNLEEKKNFYKRIYNEKSYFQKLFVGDCIEMESKHQTKVLRSEIEKLLLEKKIIKEALPLENLHEAIGSELKKYNFNDGVNRITTLFYETNALFGARYFEFIIYLRTFFLKEPFYFQKIPTIRIHCPDSVNSHHYPRFHSDIAYGHPPDEINIWIPITECLVAHEFYYIPLADSKSLLEWYQYDYDQFIEHAINDGSLQQQCERLALSVDTKYGSFFAFDSRLLHSAYPIKNHTRISIDIRIYPKKLYLARSFNYQGTGRRKIQFTPGECYYEKDSDEL